MSETRISAAAFADTKPHYELLDGLRGVAALLVVFYHIFEGLSFAAGGTLITTINHGYLAVDFFFILSGFVIAQDKRLRSRNILGAILHVPVHSRGVTGVDVRPRLILDRERILRPVREGGGKALLRGDAVTG